MKSISYDGAPEYDGTYAPPSSRGRGGSSSTVIVPESDDEYAMPFVDVSETAYYYDAVKWAEKNRITGGHFPGRSLTARQARHSPRLMIA